MYHVRSGKNFDQEPPRLLIFHGSTPSTSLIKLETAEHKLAQRKNGDQDATGRGQRNDTLPMEFCDQEYAEVTLEDLAGSKPIAPLLCFWTWTAMIRLEANGNKKFSKTKVGRLVEFCM